MGRLVLGSVVLEGAGGVIPASAGRPETWVILSRREEPPALILASRRSRRRRAWCWVGDSSLPVAGGGIWEGSIGDGRGVGGWWKGMG